MFGQQQTSQQQQQQAAAQKALETQLRATAEQQRQTMYSIQAQNALTDSVSARNAQLVYSLSQPKPVDPTPTNWTAIIITAVSLMGVGGLLWGFFAMVRKKTN